MANDDRIDETLTAAVEASLAATDMARLAEHFDAIGAPLPTIAWSPRPDDLDEPVLRSLLAYWLGLPRGRRAPLAASIDPRGMKAALGFVMLLDPVAGGRDFRFRLYGSAIAARSGRDLTGTALSEAPLAPLREFFVAGYRACLARAEPLFTRHAPPARVHIVRWDRLILPLDDGGGGICRLLVGNVPHLRGSGSGSAGG